MNVRREGLLTRGAVAAVWALNMAVALLVTGAAFGALDRDEPPGASIWAFRYEAEWGAAVEWRASFDALPGQQREVVGEVVAYTEEGARMSAGMRVKDWMEARETAIFSSGPYAPLDCYARAVSVRRVGPAREMEPLSRTVEAVLRL